MQDEDMKTIHEALSEFSEETLSTNKSKLEKVPKNETKSTKSNLKTEEEIRNRRLELFDILDEAEGSVPYKECIEGILLEYRWILNEETKKEKVREV